MLFALAWHIDPRKRKQARKQFFFEKKNQKTFALDAPIISLAGAAVRREAEITVFWFFFSKKNCLLCRGGSTGVRSPRSPA
jgi:hypothetical protein